MSVDRPQAGRSESEAGGVAGEGISGHRPEAEEALRAAVTGTVTAGADLAPLTTFRIGGRADLLVEAADEADLVGVTSVAAALGLPLLVLGRGSNMLISDLGVPGIVLRLGRSFDWIRADGDGVQAGAATLLPRLANWAGRRSLAGLEFAVGIPASVGGAVRMNAGAHQAAMADVLDWARLYRPGEPAPVQVAAASLPMRYRHGGLEPGAIVCAARLALTPAPAAEIAGRMQAHRDHRAATQPGQARNAGSMFQNPPAPLPSAGALIERAGLKGYRVGCVEVSRQHANFFVASPGARAQEVYRLLVAVQAAVLAASDVLLVPEVRLVGTFEGPPLRLPGGVPA